MATNMTVRVASSAVRRGKRGEAGYAIAKTMTLTPGEPIDYLASKGEAS